MRTEAEFSAYIWGILKRRSIEAHLEGNISDIEITNALKTASKNFTGGAGYPDILAVVKDFVLIMESKSDYLKLEKKDGTDFSEEIDAVKNYAVNGALFYAKNILSRTRYTKIFAFGNVGDEVHHVYKPIFIGEVPTKDKDKKAADKKLIITKELSPVETFIDFTAENIDNYYLQAVCGEELPEAKELKLIVRQAGSLHEYLRNYGQLGETEKPLVVSAIILAMDDGLTLDELKGSAEENLSDGEIIFNHIVNRLNTAQIQPTIKKERVLAQFQLIKNRPLINSVNPQLNQTPLRFFARYIQENVYGKIKNSSSKDYLGIFYREFVSYSGGDGQTLGVVLTPPHITELFCDLVNLQADDVVLDPCCGTGGFLIAAMNRMLALAENEDLRDAVKKNQLHGVEVRDDMFSIATTSMILRGDGKSNLICDDFFKKTAEDFFITDAEGKKHPVKFTVGFMNPPYSQAKNDATKHLSELRFIEHLLNCMTPGGRVAVIVPVSAMIGKTKDDKILKKEILKRHTLKGVISLNKNTFYQIGTVPCIAVFEAGVPHKKNFKVKFINFEDDGFELRKHEGYLETPRFKDRREYLLNCWNDNIADYPSKFMVETKIDADDEWLHSFYYYNDEKPAEGDFLNTIADYLTFEFNMITHGRGYLFDAVKKNPKITAENVPPLENKIWKTFFVDDLFEIEEGKCSQANRLEKMQNGVPYVGATNRNNGVLDFVKPVEKFILRGNCIAFIKQGEGSVGYSVYKHENFIAATSIAVGYAPFLNRYTGLFITTVADKARGRYSFNYPRSTTRLKREKLLLPVNELGEIDFKYMEDFIALREQKLIQQYLDRICPPNVSEIPPLENKIWQKFRLLDYFEFVKGDQNNMQDLKAGKIPLVSAKNTNNGYKDFVSMNDKKIFNANCLTINNDGDGGAGISYYQPTFFLLDTHVTALYPKIEMSGETLLFISRCITIQREKFGHGYSLNNQRLKVFNIILPVTETGEPDFEYMEAYSKNLFAQVLKKYLQLTK